jgi:hypothetical protein
VKPQERDSPLVGTLDPHGGRLVAEVSLEDGPAVGGDRLEEVRQSWMRASSSTRRITFCAVPPRRIS